MFNFFSYQLMVASGRRTLNKKYRLTKPPAIMFHTNPQPLSVIERDYCLSVLHLLNCNISRTAEALKISRKALYRRLAVWESEGFVCQKPL